jgi:asparagine synthase (glutamine-hydrolysing)
MCGINLILDNRDGSLQEDLHAMNGAIRHRGPDAGGSTFLQLGSCRLALGANRLKITGVSDPADQPFSRPPGRFLLLFNGEIYNHTRIRRLLEAEGCGFETASDTEVLYRWLETRGEAGIASLEGMYALVFVDTLEKTILMARDPSGIKPLFYCRNTVRLMVSSELRGLLAGGWPARLQSGQAEHYFRYRAARPPETLLEGVYTLLPGEIRVWKNGQMSGVCADQGPNIAGADQSGNIIDRTESLLEQSLMRQLPSEVQAGLLLSGGVDSTLLLALARKLGIHLPCYSLEFSGLRKNGESPALRAARQYGAEYHPLAADHTVLDEWPEFIRSLDHPVADSGAYATWLICRRASADVKVVLSGAGADELFAGYNRHLAFARYLKYRKLLLPAIPLLRGLGRLPFPQRPEALRLIRLGLNSLDADPGTTFRRMIGRNDLPGGDASAFDLTAGTEPVESLDRALEHDRRHYLVEDVLALSDWASMAASIELRVPYLDEPVVRFARALPGSERLRHGRKWILRALLGRHGGAEYARRSKEGFGLPLSRILFEPRWAHLWALFENKNHPIFELAGPDRTAFLLNRYHRRSEHYSQELWALLVLGHWLNEHIA